MNAIELYKKLPKKNCGKCSQKACMPFALSVIKGDSDLSDCPLLTEDEIRNLKNSITHMVKASSFLREAEDPIKELFKNNPERVFAAIKRLGAKQSADFPTPNAWILFLLPKVPVVILYWPKEDEFPAKVKILFDQTADKFLDVESLMFLLEGLVKNIERVLSLDNHK